MGCKIDTSSLLCELKYTNIAENHMAVPRYHMKRISIHILSLEGRGSGGGGQADRYRQLSAEDMKVLNWQDSPENLQKDNSVYHHLVQISETLCTEKSSKLRLFNSVTDKDAQQQGGLSLSSYTHFSFRRLLVTRHVDGRAELLYSHFGNKGAECDLRWRSNDYMKIEFPDSKAHDLLWLVQWDIVDTRTQGRWSGPDTCSYEEGQRSLLQFPLNKDIGFHPHRPMKHVRRRKRKSPYVAEVKVRGHKNEVWLGSFKTEVAAGRASDVGQFYYHCSNNIHDLNFEDSPRFLMPLPQSLDEHEKLEFVKAQAKQLGKKFDWSPIESTNLPTTLCGNASQSSVGDSVELQSILRYQLPDVTRNDRFQSFGANALGNSVLLNQSGLRGSNLATPRNWKNSESGQGQNYEAVQDTSCASNSFQETEASVFSSQPESQRLSCSISTSTNQQVYNGESSQLRNETYEPRTSSMISQSIFASSTEKSMNFDWFDLQLEESDVPASTLITCLAMDDPWFEMDVGYRQSPQYVPLNSSVEITGTIRVWYIHFSSYLPSDMFFIFSIQFRTVAYLRSVTLLILRK